MHNQTHDMSRPVVLIASLLAAPLVAATPRRGGEVWSRAQEDAWHAEMGYPREVSQRFSQTPQSSKGLGWGGGARG